MQLVKVDSVSKTYHGSDESIVKNVSLTINGGDFISIEGVSGSGKSSLLYMIGGLSEPSTGTVYLLGKDIRTMSAKEIAEWRGKSIGYVFQNTQMAKALTVRENIVFAARFGNDQTSNPDQIIRDLGLEEAADKLPGKLSGGQRRRAMIACVLVRNPKIILADEPTNDLDREWAGKIVDYLRSKVTDDTALVLVTHDPTWADKADIRYEMIGGKLFPN